MVNKVILVGRLTADPDVHTAATGRPVAYMRLATNTYLGKEPDGSRKEAVEYHYLVAFNHHAQFAAHLRKGSLVYVEGRNQTRTWEGEGGHSRQRTEVLIELIHSLRSNPPPPLPGQQDSAPPAGSEPPPDEGTPMVPTEPVGVN
jgi:single-strand DNA-binding protein